MKRRSIRVVVQAKSEGRALLWGEEEEAGVYVCQSSDELGSWVWTLWENPQVPAVDSTEVDSRWLKLGAKGLDALGLADVANDQGERDRVAVHCIVALDERCAGVVYPPRGGPEIVSGTAELGKVLAELARDERLPRVPAGPPPNLAGEVVERVGQGVIEYLRREGGGAA